uniref:Putative ovule protein n=1 Tax=Solanum chacoense TaxID=4108 RepID=A0A0V0GTK5_SOLCH
MSTPSLFGIPRLLSPSSYIISRRISSSPEFSTKHLPKISLSLNCEEIFRDTPSSPIDSFIYVHLFSCNASLLLLLPYEVMFVFPEL